MATKSEKLQAQVGKKIECDICHKKVVFSPSWVMNSKKEVVCPKCKPVVAATGSVLVGI